MLSIKDVPLKGRRVLMRQDLNVPMENGVITDNSRILAALPTIKYALEKGARLMLVSHLGRPKAGEYDAQFSLQAVADELSHQLNQPVTLCTEIVPCAMNEGDCILYENIRFAPGEEQNAEQFSKYLASLCDVFVMDAFATAHRAQASTVGVAEWAEISCAGLLFEKEWQTLNRITDQPEKPVLAIVGGAKVSGKIAVLEHLIERVDALIVGGGIANTFLAAQGFDVGTSLYEKDWCQRAADLMALAASRGVRFPLPQDVLCASVPGKQAVAIERCVTQVQSQEAIYDVGPKTMALYAQEVARANTIVWNGPLGVFEWPNFSYGTFTLARAIAKASGFSIAGGGDTLSALKHVGLSDSINYLSTAGGAFLQLLEGRPLPAVTILQQRAEYDAI